MQQLFKKKKLNFFCTCKAEKEMSVIWGYTDGGTNSEIYTKKQCDEIEELYNLRTDEPKEINIQTHTGDTCVINLDEGSHTNLRTGEVFTLQRKVNPVRKMCQIDTVNFSLMWP